ncbi:MFS transporter [Sporosarcina sp. P21c]|uniref:MFS transporter n=1 Tax=Sporosarcina TaxID=1569 RepID=UPI000A158A52|nr:MULTISPECIES: MFS transporter [Sporosarcina]ARJ39206.1 Inner membrane transport protein ynfM [Sporosarcina ureae]PIC66057.1 MFS transporter [Sporosarcina sp. P16a]PIC82501.1 MFS transporter [Sporosarcina sp. P1]PIC88373.1 MFS transporter [Sporosarcina sp. P21c]PIC91659.1 MFS transporter [Sporosarcina sp. P25]
MNLQAKSTLRELRFWRIVIGLGIASVLIFAAMYAMQPLLPILTKQFNVSVSTASLAMSVNTIGLIFGLVILGFYSDRLGRSAFVKVSVLVTALLFIPMFLTHSFTVILVLRFIQGFAMAGVLAAALAYINEEINERVVGVATALYISFNGTGGMLGRFVTGYLAERWSWELSLQLLTVAGVAVFIFLLFVLPKSNYFTPSVESMKKDMEGFGIHLKNPALLIVFGLGIALQLSFTGMWTFLPFHLTASPFSMTLDEVSYIYFAYAFGIIGAPLAGSIASKAGMNSVRFIGVLLLAVGCLLTIPTILPLIIIGYCIICLGFFSAHSLTAASVSKEATHHKGSASSLYLVSYYIGMAAGSTLVTPLWQFAGWTGLAMFSAVVPVVYVLLIRLRRRVLSKVQ